MAPKAHRTGATGLPRNHSRSSSSGSSKAALSLHFTQTTHKQQEKPKKNGYVYEVTTFFSSQIRENSVWFLRGSRQGMVHSTLEQTMELC